MGVTYATLELINEGDISLARKFYIGEEEIRSTFVRVLVDSGSHYLCINESINEVLGLPVVTTRKVRLANEEVREFPVVGPVLIKFQNRTSYCSAMLLPGESEPLLGAIPMQDMDVILHPLREELIVHPDHPDMAMGRL